MWWTSASNHGGSQMFLITSFGTAKSTESHVLLDRLHHIASIHSLINWSSPNYMFVFSYIVHNAEALYKDHLHASSILPIIELIKFLGGMQETQGDKTGQLPQCPEYRMCMTSLPAQRSYFRCKMLEIKEDWSRMVISRCLACFWLSKYAVHTRCM